LYTAKIRRFSSCLIFSFYRCCDIFGFEYDFIRIRGLIALFDLKQSITDQTPQNRKEQPIYMLRIIGANFLHDENNMAHCGFDTLMAIYNGNTAYLAPAPDSTELSGRHQMSLRRLLLRRNSGFTSRFELRGWLKLNGSQNADISVSAAKLTQLNGEGYEERDEIQANTQLLLYDTVHT
jgi:hypothetical protein